MINKRLSEPLKLKVINVVGGGEQEWAVIELEANGVANNGMRLHSGNDVMFLPCSELRAELRAMLKLTSCSGMAYPQRYAWFLRFDDSGIVVQVSFIFDRDTALFDRRAVR